MTGRLCGSSLRLPSVEIDSYNVELEDSAGFIGDRASKGAFRKMIDQIRRSTRKAGDLDGVFIGGESEAAGVVHAAVEEFSQEFSRLDV